MSCHAASLIGGFEAQQVAGAPHLEVKCYAAGSAWLVQNIVKCLEIFEDDLAVYFIYEYLPKGDLYNYILKKRKHRSHHLR